MNVDQSVVKEDSGVSEHLEARERKEDEMAVASRNLHTIYFYYRKYNDTTGESATKAYYVFDKDDAIRLEEHLTRLVSNAHNDGDDPPCYGGMPDLTRRRKSYFVIAVESEQNRINPSDPITFVGTSDLDVGNRNDGKHTFKHIEYTEVGIDNSGKTVTAVVCENHLKSKNGNDLDPGETEHFEFTLNYTNGLRGMYPDDGGNNLGPPVPPP